MKRTAALLLTLCVGCGIKGPPRAPGASKPPEGLEVKRRCDACSLAPETPGPVGTGVPVGADPLAPKAPPAPGETTPAPPAAGPDVPQAGEGETNGQGTPATNGGSGTKGGPGTNGGGTGSDSGGTDSDAGTGTEKAPTTEPTDAE